MPATCATEDTKRSMKTREKNGSAAVASRRNGASNGHVHGPHCNHGHIECEVRIRLYQKQDHKELTAAWKSGDIALDDTDGARAIEQNLKRSPNGYRVFVAEAVMMDTEENKPVGKPRIAGGVIFTYDGHRAYVYHLAVHRDFRGVGLGKALLETCEHQAKLWSARHLRLTSRIDDSRAPARKMYEEQGWVPEKSLVVYKKTMPQQR
jgi:ribosomal protein S18 acetylase RimI-like enzyme